MAQSNSPIYRVPILIILSGLHIRLEKGTDFLALLCMSVCVKIGVNIVYCQAETGMRCIMKFPYSLPCSLSPSCTLLCYIACRLSCKRKNKWNFFSFLITCIHPFLCECPNRTEIAYFCAVFPRTWISFHV